MALSDNDNTATLFLDAEHADDAILHRLATFHLDRFFLCLLALDHGKVIGTLEFFQNTRANVVSSFIDEGSRLGGLSIGVNAQAARPISLGNK